LFIFTISSWENKNKFYIFLFIILLGLIRLKNKPGSG
jgi:hypothetical protein